jgi:DNA replication protein DnaC
MNHASNCILSSRCKVANSAQCNKTCSHYISLHGLSSNGGRLANANAPTDYKLLTLANSPARANQAQVYATIEKYLRYLGEAEQDEYTQGTIDGVKETLKLLGIRLDV